MLVATSAKTVPGYDPSFEPSVQAHIQARLTHHEVHAWTPLLRHATDKDASLPVARAAPAGPAVVGTRCSAPPKTRLRPIT